MVKKIQKILKDGTGLPPNPTIDIQNDEFRGVGGSYIRDAATGMRTRIAGPDVGADGIRPKSEPETETGTEALAHESE